MTSYTTSADAQMDLSPEELVKLIASPALFVDECATIVSVNVSMSAFLQLHGLTSDTFSNTSMHELVAESDRDDFQGFLEQQTGEDYYQAPTDSLKFRLWESSGVAVITRLQGNFKSGTGFLVQADGTGLVEENVLWQNAVHAGRIGFWERDLGTNLQTPSPSWWQIRGYEPKQRQRISDQERLNRVHPDDRHMILEGPDEWDKQRDGYYECRFRERNRDGDWIWILSRGQILSWSEQGHPRLIAGVDGDITDLVAAEQHRAELADRLNHVERLKSIGQLTGGIAHDFNNLLAIISGSAELLEQEHDDEEGRLNDIINAVQTGAELTSSLLAFSRKQPLQPLAIDVADLLSELSNMLKRTMPEGIDLQTSVASDIWNCEADRGQLDNALINLAMNARDAMKSGGTLSIVAENVTVGSLAATQAEIQPGEYVLLSVSDTGTGMSQEALERAFEPFFTSKPVGQGTGLGLSMVFGFAEQSNGHVAVHSKLGEGCRVCLYLPRTKASVPAGRSTDCTPSIKAAPARIMVVEDDDAIRSINSRYLEGIGYQVVGFDTADKALESFCKDDSVDLLLTDLVLPGKLGGGELGAELRQLKPSLKVLYMSGYHRHEQFGETLNFQGEGFLQKPFSLRELAGSIERALASQED